MQWLIFRLALKEVNNGVGDVICNNNNNFSDQRSSAVLMYRLKPMANNWIYLGNHQTLMQRPPWQILE